MPSDPPCGAARKSAEYPNPFRNRAAAAAALIGRLQHDPDKWIPVFGKDHAQTTS
jgi:hypothetical protein